MALPFLKVVLKKGGGGQHVTTTRCSPQSGPLQKNVLLTPGLHTEHIK